MPEVYVQYIMISDNLSLQRELHHHRFSLSFRCVLLRILILLREKKEKGNLNNMAKDEEIDKEWRREEKLRKGERDNESVRRREKEQMVK